jgi:hypothetical protein
VDASARILEKACSASHILGVVPHFIPGGISHLQYVDDTMILIYNNDLAIANLKFLLISFELLSSLKINYHKSEVIVMGVSLEEQAGVANLLNCQVGAFPFKYLGFPMSDRKLTIADLDTVVAIRGNKMEPWQGRFMSSAARLVLTDACLSSLYLFIMGLFLPANGTRAGFDKHRCRFFGKERAMNANIIGLTSKRSVCLETRAAWAL